MPRLWRKTGIFLSEIRDVSRCFLRQSRGAFGVGGTGYLARFSSSVRNGSKSHGLPFSFCSDTPLNAAALSPFPMRRCPSPVAARTPLPHSRAFGLRPSPSHSGGGGFGVGVFFFIFWGFVFPSLCSYCSICLRLSPQGLCICTHCRILPHGGRFQSPA